jgi:AraC-like DNA-binding protein
MKAISNGALDLGDVVGAPAARRVVEQLDEAPSWERRFDVLESLLAGRLVDAPEVSRGVEWAWRRLHATAGAADVGRLAAELEWSRKRIVERFRDEVGLPPKRLARILRFQTVLRRLDRDPAPRWVDVAQDSGYFDQAHLIHEFREFSGSTPTDFLERLLPDGGGILGD